MNALQQKLHDAMLLLKAAALELEKQTTPLDPVYTEIAAAMACAGRAKRLLAERPE